MNVGQNTKREQIFETARVLFWKFGIRRVSVEEICREANVSKMTFYKHFKNKTDLAKKVIDRMIEERTALYKEIMSRDIPFAEKIRLTVQQKIEQTTDLSRELFLDLNKYADPDFREFLDRKTAEGIRMILQDYLEAQRNGDVRPDIKPEFILYFLNHIITLVRDENLVHMYESPQDLIIELTNFFFYGILTRSTDGWEPKV